MKKRPLVMIIINYNDVKTTMRLLENIKDYKSLSKILVVDNHSTDSSYRMLKKLETNKIKVIKTKENKGFAAGLNEGAKYIKTILPECDIIFSNADIIIYSDDNLKELQKVLHKEHIGLVGPVVCEKNTLNRGWNIPLPRQEILANIPVIGTSFQKKYHYSDDYYKGDISIVEAVSGCFFLLSLEVLEEIGYFDENTFLYYEENILATKLKRKGYQAAICNQVTIIHDHSVSIDKSVSYIHKFKQLKKSQLYFEKEYNHASKMEIFALKFFSKLTLILIYIRIFLKGGLKQKTVGK